MEAKNRISGNMFWILEAFKQVNQEIDFDQPLRNEICFNRDEILFYDCLVFNKDREDSLFVNINGTLYEYLSNDKCELILKLIKIFDKRHSKNPMSINQSVRKSLLQIEAKNFPNVKNFSNSNCNTHRISKRSSLEGLDVVMKANILLLYRDNTSKFLYEYILIV